MSSPTVDAAALMQAAAEFKDPETGRGIVDMEQVEFVAGATDRLVARLKLTTFSAPVWEQTTKAFEALLRKKFPGVGEIVVERALLDRPATKIGEIGLTAKAVIAVGSGKGGVGKSTIACCLALGLQRSGCKVGLLDADVYGPSVPHLLGVDERPSAIGKRLQPVMAGELRVMSMGFLVPPGEAVVWRGPMLHGAITQFLRDTDWGDLDFLIIDMPPGTGDIALTLSQLIPLTGAVVVCTPQDVALLDAVKAIAMFRKVSIPVLGLVENMSYFECPDTKKRYNIFGHGGAQQRAGDLDVPFLGEVPINISLRERGDAGTTATNYDDPEVAQFLDRIAQQLVTGIVTERAATPPMPTLPVL